MYINLKKLFAQLSLRRRWQLLALIFLMFAGTVAEMATLGAVVPFLAILADPSMLDQHQLLKNIFMMIGAEREGLLGAAVVFSCITIVATVIRMLLLWSSQRYSYGVGADIGAEVYRRTLYQPYSWHVARNSSEVIAGIDKVNNVIGGVLVPVVQGAVALGMSIGILVMLLWIDSATAMIAGVGFSLLYGITTLIFRRQLLRNSTIIANNATKRVQAIQEGLGGIRDILLDGSQPVYFSRFAQLDYKMRLAQASNNLIGASPRYIIESSGMVLIVVLAYWLTGSNAGLNSAIPVLGALAVGAQKLLPQIQLTYYSWSTIRGNTQPFHDVLDFLVHSIPGEYMPGFPIHPAEKKTAQSRASNAPLITLNNISFRYKLKSPDVLQDINLKIPRGARVGFIGKTGSGKSTLIDLIMGLLEPSEGHIQIEDSLLTPDNLRQWQQRIAHVPQSIYLSDSSIAENIAFGIPSAQIDINRVQTAARKAQLSGFIESLPQQYQTPVGERGVRLSGGQRQRIGLARALYKQVDVLVLDEATSALDDATEDSVIAAINDLEADLTVLMIAHRTSTLRDCDLIVELYDCRILKKGSYQNVIECK